MLLWQSTTHSTGSIRKYYIIWVVDINLISYIIRSIQFIFVCVLYYFNVPFNRWLLRCLLSSSTWVKYNLRRVQILRLESCVDIEMVSYIFFFCLRKSKRNYCNTGRIFLFRFIISVFKALIVSAIQCINWLY